MAEYNFEEGSGSTLKDISGNNNNGTWSGTGAHYAQGKQGKSGRFNGTNDYVDVGNNNTLNFAKSDPFTISAWINMSQPVGENHLISRHTLGGTNGGYLVLINGSNSLIFDLISDNGFQYYISYPLVNYVGRWVHIEAVYDGSGDRSGLKLFVDGALAATGAASVIPGEITTNQPLTLGRAAYQSGMWVNGGMDSIRIYDYARTPSQVAWDYNYGKPIAHYKMDECQGNTINDSSGNNLFGTLNLGVSGTTTIGTCNSAGSAWSNGKLGRFNSSISFDGVDDKIGVSSNAFILKTAVTLSSWIYPKSGGSSTQNIINNGNNWPYRIYRSSSNSLTGQIDLVGNNSGYIFTPSNTLKENTWQHTTLVFDGLTKKLYLNGQLVASSPAVGQIPNSSGGLWIGSCGSCEVFNGQLDDVQIFNYALTAEQIKVLYNNGAMRWGP